MRIAVAVALAVVAARAVAQDPAAPAPAAAPPAAPAPAADAQSEALRRELERVKSELRDELRAEMQAAESAKEFLQGADGELRKLEFFEVDGYLRFRTDLFSGLDLARPASPPFFEPLISPEEHSTLTNANLRLRLEPALNVSEEIRVLAQVDVLDNLVLGSTPTGEAFSFVPPGGVQAAGTDSVRVKRAWAEVQTPVGLLAFGRQRAEWGLGILENPGEKLDDDRGDSVDRLQFAIPLRSTPIGPLAVVPYYDLLSTGVTTLDLGETPVSGQPLDREQADDATALGFRVVRTETDEERRLKNEQGLASWNYGLYYGYRTQGFDFRRVDAAADVAQPVRVDASAHVLDLWVRRQSRQWRVETEVAGLLGEIQDPTARVPEAAADRVLLRQLGFVLQTAWTPKPRMTFAGELGFASGDRTPGFGNGGNAPGAEPSQVGGGDLRNFRFNPAYRVDLVLWREILGSVTDAWYLRPSARYEIIDGLDVHGAIVYSQAVHASSTPSGIHKPLGLEADLGFGYESDDGFVAWLDWGILQPLDGFLGAGDISRAHAVRTGLAVKF
jgi:uncharacterized protein (TIGR04551 family)